MCNKGNIRIEYDLILILTSLLMSVKDNVQQRCDQRTCTTFCSEDNELSLIMLRFF